MHFSDYRHFKVISLPVDMQDLNSAFVLLDPYAASTNDRYLEGHFKFTTAYLALKFIPFLGDKIWTESLSLAYLYNPVLHHFLEAGYSINNLFLPTGPERFCWLTRSLTLSPASEVGG